MCLLLQADHFNRPPTDEELDYGKMNRWLKLKLKIEKMVGVLDGGKDKEVGPLGSPSMNPATIDVVAEDQVKISSRFDSSSSNTSSNSSGDSDTSNSEEE